MKGEGELDTYVYTSINQVRLDAEGQVTLEEIVMPEQSSVSVQISQPL